MRNDVATLLKKVGPTLSSKIVDELVNTGISRETARKQVSRSSGAVRKLQGIQFPNRERFLFLEDQFGKQIFKSTLSASLKQSNTSYGRALTGLESRGGAVPMGHFAIAGGLPVENTKGQLLATLILSRLLQVGLLKRESSTDREIVSLWNVASISNRRLASLIVEDITLAAIKTWLINIGWVSRNAIKIRTDHSAPRFGQFPFDIVGPSYLNSIIHYKKGKPVNGFIVADILLDREIKSKDLEPFFSKLSVLTNQKRKARFQPLFIADWFEQDALNKLRSKGCVIARPETIFGAEVARLLRDLISTLENAAQAVTDNPTAVFTLLAKLSKLEGAALNLRGVVQELIVAHLFKLHGYSIEIRQKIQSEDGNRAEIDVTATSRQEVVCIECKGKSPGSLVSSQEIEEWLQKSVPRIKSWLKLSNEFPAKKRFEFYSSTDYAEDAKTLISEIERTHKRQPISFYNGQDLISKLHADHETALIDIFREQFGESSKD